MKKSINLAYLIWIFSVFFLIQFIISNKDITFYKNLNVGNTSTFEILPKAEFRQYFVADEDGLKSLVLRFDTSQKENSNNIEFELIDNATGNIIHKEILNAEAIPADGYKSISFEKQNSKKHTYYFNLRGISGQSDRHLTLLLDKTSGEHYENSVLSTASAIYNLSYNIKIYFYLFVSIFFGILGFLFFKYVGNREIPDFKTILKPKRRFLIFCLVFAEALLFIYFIRWFEAISGDMYLYWDFLPSKIFGINGFDLLRPDWYYHYQSKGYLYPVLLSFVQKIAELLRFDPYKLFHITNCFIFAWFIIYFMPAFVKKLFMPDKDYKPNLLSYFLFAQFIFIFWNGYLFYPLSDFQSVIPFFIGVYFLATATDKDFLQKDMYLYLILSGISIGIAYNIRSINLFGLYVAILYLIILGFANKRLFITILSLIFLITGFLIPNLPQLYINIYKYNIISFMIGGFSTNLLVLSGGSYSSKYETYIGLGVMLFRRSDSIMLLGNSLFNFGSYNDLLNFCINNIGYYISLSFEKILNSIDLWYDTPYLIDIYKNNLLFRNLNYIIWFVGFISLCLLRLSWRKWLLLLIAIVPALVAYLGHVEIRYFLHLYLLIYCLIAFVFVDKFRVFLELMKNIKLKKYIILFLFICFLLFMNGWANYTKSLANVPLLVPYYVEEVFHSGNDFNGSNFAINLEMDKIYKVDFVVNNAKNCKKVDVFLKVGNYQAQHTRLPFFYSDKYYVLFQPMESGLGDISFKTLSDDNNCQVTEVVVNKGR